MPKQVLSELECALGEFSSEELVQIAVDAKAAGVNFEGRFREIVSDPINLLIKRHPLAGFRVAGNVVLHNGLQVPACGPLSYYGAFSSILAINRGVHEPLEEFVFQEVLARLPEKPVMLELGAYWSHYSMWLKKCWPEGNVFMVEPEAANLRVGRNNFELNGLTGTFIQGFVGNGNFGVDEFLDRECIDRLHILHADIQGFEVEMLGQASLSLSKRKIDYIFVSTHSQDLHGAVVNALVGHGYRIEISSDYYSQTTSHDGLVVASVPHLSPVLGGFHPIGRKEILNALPEDLLGSLLRSRYSPASLAGV
jgi:hypothetical protein